MIRKIIRIDETICNGCGNCITACDNEAIELVKGKAKLIRDDFCSGNGECISSCNESAISFEQKETIQYDREAVEENKLDKRASQLNQWPIQLKLVSTDADFFKDANLLIAGDCTAYAYGNFHNKFMKNKITLIGCSKLDEGNYSNKLTTIIKKNDLKSITIVHMEKSCCSGIVDAVKNALHKSGKLIPWQIVTISVDGKIVE